MITDSELKDDVIDELIWDASVNETNIGVAIKNGIVTLSGTVDNYFEKISAEKAAKRVVGVKAVVMDIEVKISGAARRTDAEIAEAALNSLKRNASVPKDAVTVRVENGWVTLDGHVSWNYQKEAAKTTIQNLYGVKGVSNMISVKSKPSIQPINVKENIKKSFRRIAELEAGDINVEVEGHKVTLIGTVHSWNELKQAEDAAWSAPGVWQVENKLAIRSRVYA